MNYKAFAKISYNIWNITIVLLFLCPTRVFADQYLCIVEHATGFRYSKTLKEWNSVVFKDDSKYLITPAKDKKCWPDYPLKTDKCEYLIKTFGENGSSIKCTDPINDAGFLRCLDFDKTFSFNNKNNRFLYSFTNGYTNIIPHFNQLTDEGSDTPFIEIGSCTKMEE